MQDKSENKKLNVKRSGCGFDSPRHAPEPNSVCPVESGDLSGRYSSAALLWSSSRLVAKHSSRRTLDGLHVSKSTLDIVSFVQWVEKYCQLTLSHFSFAQQNFVSCFGRVRRTHKQTEVDHFTELHKRFKQCTHLIDFEAQTEEQLDVKD